VAEEGRYSVENVPGYVTNYEKCGTKKPLSDYYEIRHDVISFNSSLKRNLVFIAHNLVTDKSFNEFQLVICRNVLIYFTPRLQNEVLNLFYESLCPFGFLGLGSKESLLFAEKRKLFEVVDGKEKLYRKIQ
jgi:chemotaxis protein methyltransferase CheR